MVAVLLVEDDPLFLGALQRMLQSLSHHTLAAAGVEDALALAHRRRADLVVIDLTLDGGDGCALARHLVRVDGYADVPLLAITGHVEPSLHARARGCGFDDVLVKPFRRAELQDRIERLVTATEARRVSPPPDR